MIRVDLFSCIADREPMKRALIFNAINPFIGILPAYDERTRASAVNET